MLRALACAAAFVLLAGGASAQVSSPSQCGPTSVGTVATAITFPASGTAGAAYPLLYLSIANPSATASLWVNAMPGGTAAPNAAGSFLIAPGAPPLVWSNMLGMPPPRNVNVIATSPGSPMTCAYQ